MTSQFFIFMSILYNLPYGDFLHHRSCANHVDTSLRQFNAAVCAAVNLPAVGAEHFYPLTVGASHPERTSVRRHDNGSVSNIVDRIILNDIEMRPEFMFEIGVTRSFWDKHNLIKFIIQLTQCSRLTSINRRRLLRLALHYG